MRWLGSAGAATSTDTPSTDCAVPSPNNLLMPSVSRAEVVKSGTCRLSMTYGSVGEAVRHFALDRRAVRDRGPPTAR